MERLLLPVGIDNFAELIQHRNSQDIGYLFTDKSLLIREFVDTSSKITLITRPRRFGKSLNLSMLQHFFAPDVYGVKTKGLFDGLQISQHPEIMAYQGKSPAIFLTLKNVRGKTFEELFAVMQGEISDLFRAHDHLLESTGIKASDKKFFEQFIMEEATQSKCKSALRFLSQLLYQHTGQKVIILLDEYDTPLHDAHTNKYYEPCRAFMASFLGNALKGNSAVEKCLVTGILKIAQSSLFSELNNLEVHTVLSRGYAQYFGFTEEETQTLLDQTGLTQHTPKVKEMYNGYEIGESTLYNPFSIIYFIKEAQGLAAEQIADALKPYWIHTGANHLIGEMISNNLPKVERSLMQMIQGETMQTAIDDNLILNAEQHYDTISLWTLLLFAGYLKITGKTRDEYDTIRYALTFPNQEVRKSMQRIFLYVAAGDKNSTVVEEGIRALARGKVELFTTFLADYLMSTVSYLDTQGKKKEQFYHMLLLGMVSCLNHTHHITSNREAGKGRYDIALHPKNKDGRGIIMELKATSDPQSLHKEAAEALAQIQDKQYDQLMRQQGVQKILHLGIACCGKEMVAVNKSWEGGLVA